VGKAAGISASNSPPSSTEVYISTPSYAFTTCRGTCLRSYILAYHRWHAKVNQATCTLKLLIYFG